MKEFQTGVAILYILFLFSIMIFGLVYRKAVQEAVKKMGLPAHHSINGMLTFGILFPFVATLISLSVFIMIL